MNRTSLTPFREEGASPHLLTVAGFGVRQDADGRYSLNDLHRAAGGEPKHTPGRFTITQQFKDLSEELSRNQDSPPSTSGAGIGTFVAKELVYAYAMWISPKFHLQVIRAYDAAVVAPAPLNLADPASLRTLLLGYTEKVLELQTTVAAQAPKVAFADAVGNATNTQTVSQVAKVLGIGPRKLFDFLRTNGILMVNNLPFQHHIECGRFKVIEVPYKDGDGADRVKPQARVTGKGVTFIQQRLAKAQEVSHG